MGWHTGLNPLRDVLADLYPVASVARVVVTEAGIAEQLIDWDGAAVEFWKSILTKAHNNDQIQDLIDVARSHFPKNTSLMEAERSFHEMPKPDPAGTPEEQQPGAADQTIRHYTAFDQRGQTVKTQYNISGDYKPGTV